jgi:alkaline phosphatase
MFKKCKALFGVVIVSACLFVFIGACGESKPKNVILMIVDGGGFNHSLAASYWEYGEAEKQVYNSFPVKLAVSTFPAQAEYPNANLPPQASSTAHSLESKLNPCYDNFISGVGYDPNRAWKEFSYVENCYTDSAAAGTALATGVKTDNGSINVDIHDVILKNVIEVAEDNGKATGIVTTKEIVDATPAAFTAHNINRMNSLEISDEMINDSAVDVIMGSGNPFYDDNSKLRSTPSYSKISKTDWDALVAGTAGGDADGDSDNDPWTLIQEREQFQAMAKGSTPSRVFGIAQASKTLQQLRDGNPGDNNQTDDLPYEVPLTANVPTLAEMTEAALNILDDDKDGFFLMVEGGAVDYAAHAGQSGRMIEEHIDFERSVEAVVAWVNAESNWNETMIIITADHETGYLNGPGSIEAQDWLPLINNGKVVMPGMEWAEPAPLPPGAPAYMKSVFREHTNCLVPLWAKGGISIKHLKKLVKYHDPMRGSYIDNTEIGRFIKWIVVDREHAF